MSKSARDELPDGTPCDPADFLCSRVSDGAAAGAKASHFYLTPSAQVCSQSSCQPSGCTDGGSICSATGDHIQVLSFTHTPVSSEQQPRPQTICAQSQGATPTTSACQQVPQPVCYGQVKQKIQNPPLKSDTVEYFFPRTSRALLVRASSAVLRLLSRFAARCLAGFLSGGIHTEL